MVAAVVSIWALLMGIAFLMLGAGLQGTLLGVRANLAGFPTTVTGIIMAGYFVGFLFGSTLTPRLVQRVGHIRVFGAMASIASIAPLIHSVAVEPIVWTLMRVLTGFAYASLYIVAESWLNDRSTNETRGQLLSVYMVIMLGAMAAGPLLLNTASPDGYVLFIVSAVLVSLAVVPISLTAYPAPEFHAIAKLKLRQLMRISPLGVAGCILQGAAAGTMVGLGAVYAQDSGLPLSEVALFVTAIILGGMILQWPIGHLSDRFDRRRVLTAATLASGAVAVAGALLGASDPMLLLVIGAGMGGLSFPIYSLALAHTNDFLEPKQMVAASSGLLMASGIGGVAGPIAAGLAMTWVGPSGFFWFLAAIHAALGLFAVYRMTRRPARPNDEQHPYVGVPRTSIFGAEIAANTVRDQMDRDLARMSRQ
jgi:MFS family permease